MAQLIPDDIDFAAYERETECRILVRKASVFADDLEAEFEPSKHKAAPTMRSTKLAHAIEFRPGEVTVWAGYNGHRKSMFTGQVALDLCAQNQRSLVLSLEMPPGRTLGRMAKQACATDVPSRQRRDEFMRWTDGRLWLFDHIGRLTPSRCLAVLRYFAEELRGQHVFIDSFMKVVESEEKMDEQKAMIGNLCDVAKETSLHVHVIAHCRKPNGGAEDKPPTKYDIKGSGAISDQCHNVLLVWDNKAKRAEMAKCEPRVEVRVQPDFIVTLDKQRNGSVEGKFGLAFDHRSLRFCDSDMAPVDPYRMEAA
jgi:twinkle protein